MSNDDTSEPDDHDPMTIGLSMSGGGYRATAWGLGALLALTDMRAAPAEGATIPRVSMVASVSGGSITNGDFGLGIDLATADAAAVDARAARLAPRLAGRRPFFLPVIGAMVLVHVILGVWGDGWIGNEVGRWAVASVVAALVGVVVGRMSGDLLFGWWPVWVYVGVILATASGTVWILFGSLSLGQRLLVGIAGIAVLAIVLAPRPYVVQRAMHSYLRGSGVNDPTLAGLGDGVVHVICTAEVSGSNLLYLGSGFAHNEDYGSSVDVDRVPVAAAVQASSNLPGAFPIRWLSTARLGLTGGDAPPKRFLPVTDGGAYDNMGSQWFTGLERRITRMTASGGAAATIAGRLTPPDVVVIANASGLGKTQWSPLVGIPLVGWVLGLLRIKTILYEQTTASRRTSLVNDRFGRDDPPGALVHITSTPDALPRFLDRTAPTPATARALAALDALGVTDWPAQARQNAEVTTAFWPLPRTRISQVIQHAYLQTMVDMHVKFGTPLRVPPRAEFDRLVDGETRDVAPTSWITGT